MTESAGDHQNLHSDRTTTFAEDDVLADEVADTIEEFGPDADEPAPRRPSREGLPPGFRMRHESHYVDELTRTSPSIRHIAVAEIDRDLLEDDEPDALDALTNSIRRAGVLQPLLVAPRRGRFHIIDGTKRLQAASLAGLRHVPCIVHDVDEAAARAMRDSANVHSTVGAPIEEFPQAVAPAAAEDLAETLETAAAQAAICARGTSVKTRAAEDVLRAELLRASRLARAAAILNGPPHLRRGDVTAKRIVERTTTATAIARRLAGVRLETAIDDPEFRVPADVALVTQALASSIDVMLALTADVRKGDADEALDLASAAEHALGLRVRCVKTRPAIIIELTQRAVSVEPESIGRFFDAAAADHPGGPSAGLLLATAARIIRAHGGRADVRRDGAVGCTITFVLPQSTTRIEC